MGGGDLRPHGRPWKGEICGDDPYLERDVLMIDGLPVGILFCAKSEGGVGEGAVGVVHADRATGRGDRAVEDVNVTLGEVGVVR